MPINHEEIAQLPSRLQQGGVAAEQAARQLYDLLWHPLARFFVRHRQDEAMAEDLVHETLSKVVLQIHSLRDNAAFLGWIWRIARNVLHAHVRDNAPENDHETKLDEDAWQILCETHADATHGDIVVQLCLQGQLEKFRNDHPDRAYVIEQAVLEGWDSQTLSAILGRSYGATREYLSQCRKKIAEYLRLCLDSAHHHPPE
jgi:RNA polymerase sigma-70 factor (ECF subfamily)